MNRGYYEDELHYLRDVGPEFARHHPELAGLLADPGSDPDVERLLEGVAFLCGRIRHKLDDELPELTASIMSLLWPHYLRPVPSMAIIEMLPAVETMQAAQEVPAGAEFASIPVEGGTRCRYRASSPTMLRPWRIKDARLETAAARPVRLVLTLQLSSKAKPEDMALNRVRLHLTGDVQAFPLYLLLTRHVDFVTVGDGGEGLGARGEGLGARGEGLGARDEGRGARGEGLGARDAGIAVAAAGLGESEGVLPYPAHAFAGYRLLQEYFAFKDRFLFVDVVGLDRAIPQLSAGSDVTIAFTFNHRPDTLPLISRENVRLHCVPAINLVTCAAEPIRTRFDRTSYLVQPAGLDAVDRRHLEVLSVDQVKGVTHSETPKTHTYVPFYSFRHGSGDDRGASRFYQTSIGPNVHGGDPQQGTDTHISFVIDGDFENLGCEETISIDLTCTNRHLPALLRAGDICEPTDFSPSVPFRNISRPTATVCPPMGRQLHWRLISHLSLNYVSLADLGHFKELLKVYDFLSSYDAQRSIEFQRLLDGIIDLRSGFSERMFRGSPVRGTRVTMTLNEDHFAGEGDAILFSSIMDRFLGLYATLNAFSQLTVKFQRSGRIYEFPARWGEQISPAERREL